MRRLFLVGFLLPPLFYVAVGVMFRSQRTVPIPPAPLVICHWFAVKPGISLAWAGADRRAKPGTFVNVCATPRQWDSLIQEAAR